jgi:Putative beta-barrel porin 2
MKKFFVSLGLAAAGTASLQAAYAPGLDSMQTTKIWSVSTTLRGFYDDNYATASNGSKQGSAGFEVSPTVSLNVPTQQTEYALKYTYGLYYYQKRQDDGQDPVDQSHQVDMYVDHAFTERVQGKADDTVAIGQEPALLNSGNSGGAETRADGNNLVNTATLTLNTDWTRLFSTVLTYQNAFTDYENNGTTTNNLASDGASLSALLNRVDQSIGMDFQWHVAPETTALIGYKFEWVNYTGDQPIALNTTSAANNPYYYSSSRNTDSHYVYVGGTHNFLPNLAASANVGVQYINYRNDPGTSPETVPYAAVSSTYTYAPGCYAELGYNHQQNATDVVAPSASGKITQSQESDVVFVTVNQQLTPKLAGSAIFNFENSVYNGGASANEADQDYNIGLNLTYAFTVHFSGMLGYNFDDLQSDIAGRGYSRNRVYMGVTAAY